jgi:RsmE family RNA methyltransferase
LNLILFRPEELGRPLAKRDERAVHLVKVLRKGRGDEFDAGVLGGELGRGRIEAIAADGSLGLSFAPAGPPPPLWPLRIAVGFPRPIQLRRLLRDLSNLGVRAVDLLGTELGEKSYRDTTLLSDGGAEAALVEGAVQARSTRLPALAAYPSLAAWLAAESWGSSPRALVAPDNVRPRAALARLEWPAGGGEAVLAIGSERGWSDAERGRLEAAGFVRASMGDRALRTETACVAAAVLALAKLGVLD